MARPTTCGDVAVFRAASLRFAYGKGDAVPIMATNVRRQFRFHLRVIQPRTYGTKVMLA